jgi:hypothetical protein
MALPPSMLSITANSRAFLLQQPRDAVDVLGAFGGGHLAPHGVVGLAGGLHGGVHIGLVGLGDARELLLVGGVDGVEVLAALGLHPLAADEELVLRLQFEVVLAFGSRGELPIEWWSCFAMGCKDRCPWFSPANCHGTL